MELVHDKVQVNAWRVRVEQKAVRQQNLPRIISAFLASLG